MLEQDIMTGIWLLGAIALTIIALLLAITKRGKALSVMYNKSRWLLVSCNVLLAIDILMHLVGNYHEENTILCWTISIAFIVLMIPLYYLAIVNILRESQNDIPQDIEPETPEPTLQEDSDPPVTTNDSTQPIDQWISERHFTDPDITVDKALEQMGISITTLNYYMEQHTEAGSFRKWLAYLRIEEAKRMMLEHPEYAFQAIAEACGYSNNASLSRSFKAQEGMPPSEWLAKQQNKKHQ